MLQGHCHILFVLLSISYFFNLYQVTREAVHDTKGLLASGLRSIVLAARGTATRKAALVDLQASPLPRTPFLPWVPLHYLQPGVVKTVPHPHPSC